ncbi:MAG: helix-turn-helix domain-containing protein [Akkermansiaceae bacterium]|nr:helix-turn-helix domain-containing protein [Akkermansiaceae bacterium]NJR42408.1 helix-turn-helix domain-containing protein [Akkermansiaceae bacterium]
MKVTTAMEYTGLGRSFLYELMGNGHIKSHKVEGARLIDRESLETFISSQAA